MEQVQVNTCKCSIIYNKIIPFKGFKAINLFGLIFVRKGCTFTDVDLNHEKIHSAQMRELLYIFFYLWYGIEWLVLLCKYKNTNKAYKNIRFEKEAYVHKDNKYYLDYRTHFAFLSFK